MRLQKVVRSREIFWKKLTVTRISSYLWLALITPIIGSATTVQAAASALLIEPIATRIEGMPVFAQQRYLSCEYAATRAATARWGVYLREEDFINAIPTNDNPHLGFRGDINGVWGGTNNYGIYAEPIALFLATKGLKTKLIAGGIDALKEEVALGRPVVVWISGGLRYTNPYSAEVAGQSFLLMPYEHTVTIYGYDEKGFFVADPGYGTYDYYNWEDFKKSWAYLGNMALSVWPAEQGMVQGERPGIAPQFYRYWLRNQGAEGIGQPLNLAYTEADKTLQYFEYARLEANNSEQNKAQAVVERGLLGRELTEKRQLDAPFQALSSGEVSLLNTEEQSRYLPLAGFVLGSDFANFWWQRGGVETFGYPISRPFYEEGRFVQYFERTRLQLQVIRDLPPVVQMGRLGIERLAASA